MSTEEEEFRLLAAERRRILEGPAAGEIPRAGGPRAFWAICDQESATVLHRVHEVMLIVHRLGYSDGWPNYSRWNAEIPSFFKLNCGTELTRDELEAQYERWRTHPISVNGQEGNFEVWSLGEWLFWMQPEERWWWHYWDGKPLNENIIEFFLDINDAGPLGAVRWLFRGCGAMTIREVGGE